MPAYFADSSTLVKRYVQETGSVWVSGLFAPFPHDDVHIVSITTVEIVAALMRRSRTGTITTTEATTACSLFLPTCHLIIKWWRFQQQSSIWRSFWHNAINRVVMMLCN